MKHTFPRLAFPIVLTLLTVGGCSAAPRQQTDPRAADSATGKRDYVSWVDPRIETGRGRWFFSTPAARPFGMVKLTPHSINGGQGGGGSTPLLNAAQRRSRLFVHKIRFAPASLPSLFARCTISATGAKPTEC